MNNKIINIDQLDALIKYHQEESGRITLGQRNRVQHSHTAEALIKVKDLCHQIKDEQAGITPTEEILEAVQPPIGAFIFAQQDITPVMTANGAYYHYADVCKLLNRVKKQDE